MQSNNPYDISQPSAPAPVPVVGLRSVRIKRIDAVSTGTMMGALYAFLGLIVGGVMFLMAFMGVAIGGGGGNAAIGGIVGGVLALIGLPIFYGVLGFVGGLIGAALYNLIAGFVGGIQMDVEG